MDENAQALSFSPQDPQQSAKPLTVAHLRTFLYALSIIFFLAVLVFLIYHNGKSIYANGL
jgi:hypothetical protein